MNGLAVETLEPRRLLAAALNDSSNPGEQFDAAGTRYFQANDGGHDTSNADGGDLLINMEESG